MDANSFVGTLVRGTTYVVRNRSGGDDLVFEKGIGLVIDETLCAYLADVVDEVAGLPDVDTGDVEITSKPKFQFEVYQGARPIGAIAQPVEVVTPTRKKKAA